MLLYPICVKGKGMEDIGPFSPKAIPGLRNGCGGSLLQAHSFSGNVMSRDGQLTMV